MKRISRAELVSRRIKASDRDLVLAQLRWVEDEKGFKPGWKAHKYRELFGEWPRVQYVEREPPSSDLLTWLERERRNYGARRKREEAKRADQFSQ